MGMLLYALGSLIFVAVSLWLGLAFHRSVLFMLYGGYGAQRKLTAMVPTEEILGKSD